MLVVEHVTGGGLAGRDLPTSWAAEGSAIRRALAKDFAAVPGVQVVMTLDARLPEELGPWTVVRVGAGDYGSTLDRLVAEAESTAPIAPETSGALRDLLERIDLGGGRSLGSTVEAVELAGDKLRLAEHLERHGIPTPPSRRAFRDGPLPRDIAYPAVIKPIDGAGSVGTRWVHSASDLSAWADPDLGPVALIQPFFVGEPRSATFLARPGLPARLLGVGRQDVIRIGASFAYRGGTLLDEELSLDHPARLAVDSIEGLAGPVGVDYLQTPDGPVTVIEVNPRPTTSCVGLVVALGPGRLGSAWLGLDNPQADLSEIVRSQAPLRFLADGTIASPDSERTAIERGRCA